MSVYSQIRDALFDGSDALIKRTEYTPQIIFSHGNGLEPNNDYIVINILGLEQTGRVYNSSLTDGVVGPTGLKSHFQSFHEARVQFSFYGSNSGDIADVFHRYITNYTMTRDDWCRFGLAPNRKTQIVYNPQLRDTQWVDAFNFTVTFAYGVHESKEVDWVEHVTINTNGRSSTIPPVV